jgi:hypothetical protein
MEFKYTLPEEWIDKVSHFREFANGGTQVSIKVNGGTIYERILISNCMWVVAMKGYKDLPFAIDDIVYIFRTDDDINPKKTEARFLYWDDWNSV